MLQQNNLENDKEVPKKYICPQKKREEIIVPLRLQ